jgi:hypothetical protein
MNPHTKDFMVLFEGNREAYGRYQLADPTVRGDGKIKGHGVTVRKPVEAYLWDDHLGGKTRLGIIPINENNACKFGAIDIDDYAIKYP